MNVTLMSIAIGLLAGFNVLGSNAFGDKKFYLLGVYFHRSILVSYSVVLMVIIIHLFTC